MAFHRFLGKAPFCPGPGATRDPAANSNSSQRGHDPASSALRRPQRSDSAEKTSLKAVFLLRLSVSIISYSYESDPAVQKPALRRA
jgi:hypothetical protein